MPLNLCTSLHFLTFLSSWSPCPNLVLHIPSFIDCNKRDSPLTKVAGVIKKFRLHKQCCYMPITYFTTTSGDRGTPSDHVKYITGQLGWLYWYRTYHKNTSFVIDDIPLFPYFAFFPLQVTVSPLGGGPPRLGNVGISHRVASR